MTNRRVVAVIAVVLALTGCAGRESPGVPLADDAGSASPSATSTPWPPAIGDLVLSTEGVDYLQVGSPVASRPSDRALVTWSDDYYGWGADNPSRGWFLAYTTVPPDIIPFYVESQSETGPIDVIFVFSDEIRTADGLGIGSSLAEVRALGGELTDGETPDYIDAWVIHGDEGELIFWMANTSKSETPKDVAGWIQLQPEGTEPTFSFSYGCV